MHNRPVSFFLLLLLLAACSGPAVVLTATPVASPSATIVSPAATMQVSTATFSLVTTPVLPTITTTHSVPSQTLEVPTVVLPSATATHDAEDWESLPVIPTISETVLNIYKTGQNFHNNPRVFSKVGDCETSSGYFLSDFDLGPNAYDLGPFSDLQTVIQYFSGSFGRKSLAAGQGYTASSAISMIMADPSVCRVNETPLLCEYRLNKPSFALIMFGTNDTHNSRSAFEANMRWIINYSIKNGVVPVLATKADNLEGDMSINAIIAKLAIEYDIPLWNFWAAVHQLPGQGLEGDGAHLTYFPDNFEDSQALQFAFPVRNLTALQMLDALLDAVNQDSE